MHTIKVIGMIVWIVLRFILFVTLGLVIKGIRALHRATAKV